MTLKPLDPDSESGAGRLSVTVDRICAAAPGEAALSISTCSVPLDTPAPCT